MPRPGPRDRAGHPSPPPPRLALRFSDMRSATSTACLVLGRTARKIVVEPRQAVLRARMAFWVALISVVARATSLPRAQRIASFGLRSRSADRASVTPEELGAAIDSVLGIDLFVFRRSCWKRAMVLQRFLSLNGTESRLYFGVQKTTDGTVSGHAWLESEGRKLLERDTGTYIVTFALPLQEATGRERSAG
jgi:Transglutaminase-like superfamily